MNDIKVMNHAADNIRIWLLLWERKLNPVTRVVQWVEPTL